MLAVKRPRINPTELVAMFDILGVKGTLQTSAVVLGSKNQVFLHWLLSQY